MSSVCLAVEKIKSFAKSSSDFVDGLFRRRQNSARRSPIEILKRLQREAFSDVMKLRERQEKVEQMLSFCKASKRSLLQEGNGQVRGELDVLGPVLVLGESDGLHDGAGGGAGVEAGLNLRLLFEAPIGRKNTLVAEILAGQRDPPSSAALALAKVLYVANIREWFSAIAIPFGAQFKDFGITSIPSFQRKGLTDHSSTRPSFLNEQNGMAIGLIARTPSVHAVMAQSLSEETGHVFSTFGQITSKFPHGLLLSILGIQQLHKPAGHFNFGSLRIPSLPAKHAAAKPPVTKPGDSFSATGSIALKMESELDDSSVVGGWIEVNGSSPTSIRWAVSAFDDSDCETGWGFSVGGLLAGTSNRGGCFQAESYVKLNLEDGFSLKPGIVYEANGDSRSVSLVLRSNCSF